MRHYLKDKHWTETNHKAGRYEKPGQVWDHASLNFAGVQKFCEDNAKDGRHKRPSISGVRFALLAANVVVFPSGDDELDLTGCVKAAAANEDLPLLLPRDYHYLKWFLGGSQTMNSAHRDRELFDRWRQVSWVETSSEQQINAAWTIAHYHFTAAQKATTEQYLQQFTPTGLPALGEIRSLVNTPTYARHGQYVPSPNNDPLSVNPLLLGQSIHDLAVELPRILARMSEDEMDALCQKWLTAHKTAHSRSRRTTTSTSNVVRRNLERHRSLHNPILLIVNEASVTVPSSGALSYDIPADSYGSWPLPPVDWHVDHHDSSTVPVKIGQIDPEILKTSSPEMTDPQAIWQPGVGPSS
ncbi:hypothetical protein G6011_00279 [Alternaria panax]|uniref:Uncharacterized protein n=1 Tax=Alternaria panax TaxID=48097 RepID=A0AAD4NUX0_9PLEO|nr:hypothetical protein G6011_00279 [Alternaria panax]